MVRKNLVEKKLLSKKNQWLKMWLKLVILLWKKCLGIRILKWTFLIYTMAYEVMYCLSILHENNISHKNIRPGNIHKDNKNKWTLMYMGSYISSLDG